MKRLIYLIIPIFLLGSCVQQELSPDEIAKVNESIKSQLHAMQKAYNLKDIESMKSIISESDDIMIFGTDVAEVIKSASDWEQQMDYDFQLIESVEFGELQNHSIKVSKYGELAASVSETPIMMVIKRDTFNSFFRFAYTWNLENESWRIVQGVIAIASENQSSKELIEQMKKEETEE